MASRADLLATATSRLYLEMRRGPEKKLRGNSEVGRGERETTRDKAASGLRSEGWTRNADRVRGTAERGMPDLSAGGLRG
jgi:hypothetical protein